MINRRDFRLTNLIIFSLLTLFFLATHVESKTPPGQQGLLVEYLQSTVDDDAAEGPSISSESDYGWDYEGSFDKTFNEPVKDAHPSLLMVAM